MTHLKSFFVLALLVFTVLTGCDSGTDNVSDRLEAPFPCENGQAMDTYDCENVDLFAVLTPEDLGGTRLNDIWGWEDPQTGKEYALVGLTDGISFVDISNPASPVVLGKLEEAHIQPKTTLSPDIRTGCDIGIGNTAAAKQITQGSSWRDMKVFDNHLFVVKDYSSSQRQPHGMQVFDLTKLRDVSVSSSLVSFTEDALYTEFYNAHNIVINEETGFAYATGITDSKRCGGGQGSGLHIVDINDPKNPTYAGCYIDSSPGNYRVAPGYIHDAQCVNYSGPDLEHRGKEVCFNSSEGNVVIADVTDKSNPKTLGYKRVTDMYYSHQGWLTEDQEYFLMNDELDEYNLGRNTKTYIWDVRDLDSPVFVGYYTHDTESIDHNLYVKGNYTFESNYKSGLRILDIRDIASANLQQVAYFDTQTDTSANTFEIDFDGTWSNYPYFKRDIVAVSDISHGLFILRPNLNN